ncbi:hypothetical protein [Microbacterium kyungheense]|uniref:Uncharacterized protein n=1 Tax=Microbacterium kyungheense TaxID=1263636 RepID=A0A543EU75_9MICO|nr:hypothetical protein [Microbacterium kyungheense]TQM25116.1 hypothetical protein FB391_2575 [Microbacterium kyungheense]
MTKGIDLAIAADTRSAMSAITRGVIDPLEDVSDLLEQIGDQRDTDKLERGMRDAQRRTEDAKSEIRDLRDELNKAGRAGKSAGDDIDDGMRKAEAGVKDLKDESNSTAREAAASFDGSAESIADAFQEVAANAFAGFGPAGAVAGLAVAAGIGLGIAAIDDMNERTKLSEENIASWAQKYVESGGRIISASEVVGGVIAIATDPEQFKTAAENAKNWGVDVSTAMRAMSGDATALNVVQGSVNDMQREWSSIVDEAGNASDGYAAKNLNLTSEQVKLRDQLFAGADAFRELTGEMSAGKDRADLVTESLVGLINDTKGATKEVDELGNELYTLPDNTQIMIDAKTGQATQNVTTFKGDLDGIPEAVTSTVKLRVDKSEWDNLKLNPKTVQVLTQGGAVGRTGTTRQLLQ